MVHTPNYAPRYTIADAFSGCGGLSLGFAMTRRFKVLLGLDIKPEALETFALNHAVFGEQRPATLLEDITRVSSDDIKIAMQSNGASEIDCLIGGPPCEGFSQNRTDKDNGTRVHKFIDDPRNQLFKWFVDLASRLQPKVVVIENVPDLIRHRDGATRAEVFAALDEAGYVTSARVLNAAEYGVPQIRRRAIFLAQRKNDLTTYGLRLGFPMPTHKPYPMMHNSLMDNPEWLPGDSGYWVTVREAIGDLPHATNGSHGEFLSSSYPDAQITTFRKLMRANEGVIYNHLARKLGSNGLARIRAIRPGQICDDLPDELRPKSYHHYSYSRLVWSEPAHTITKFVYHTGSGQFGHPEEDRVVTMREAARLQSFPDDFRFVGTNEIRKISAMIGSAVPPLLARALAIPIAQYLDALHLASMEPTARREAKTLRGDAVLRRMESEEWNGEKQSVDQLTLFNQD